KFIRSITPQAALVLGPVPSVEQDQAFPQNGHVPNPPPPKFVIRREKCPNRRGIELLISKAAGATRTFDEFLAAAGKVEYAGVWMSGGYIQPWVTKPMAAAAEKIPWLVLHDMLPSDLAHHAGATVPALAFAEREGSFMNHTGLIQPFEPALPPPEG